MKNVKNNFKETFGLAQVTLFTATLRSCFPRGMFKEAMALCTHQNKEIVLQQKLLRYAMEYLSHLNSDY